jgi:hypothetical protein
MLAGFYHRSVLRCGCLAERNPGVEGILAGVQEIGRAIGQKSDWIVTNRVPPRGQRRSVTRIYDKRRGKQG